MKLTVAPDSVHAPVLLAGSTLNTTGFPDPPPVADKLTELPTVPVAGALNVIVCAGSATSVALADAPPPAPERLTACTEKVTGVPVGTFWNTYDWVLAGTITAGPDEPAGPVSETA